MNIDFMKQPNDSELGPQVDDQANCASMAFLRVCYSI